MVLCAKLVRRATPRRRFLVLFTVFVAVGVGAGTGAWAQAEPAADEACRNDVERAAVLARSAQYDEAEVLYDRAATVSSWCWARAQAGMAEVWNSRGNEKKAGVSAEAAIAGTDDPAVQALAYHQLGRSLFRKGQRAGKRTARAEDAFRQAVTLTEGQNERMVHALARLYRETKQTDALADLVAAYPDIKLWTREDQAALFQRTVSPCTRPTAPSFWQKPLPRFAVRTGPAVAALEDIEPNDEADADVEDEAKTPKAGTAKAAEGTTKEEDAATATAEDTAKAEAPDVELPQHERPTQLSGTAPQYTDLARRSRVKGVAKLEAWVSKEGAVERIRTVRGLDPSVVRAAQEAICGWTFEPLQVDGEAHPFYLDIDADFQLE